jgi:hypothetical protein
MEEKLSKLILGGRYVFNVKKRCTLVGFDDDGDILVLFDDVNYNTPFGTTTYSESVGSWDNLIEFKGDAVGYSECPLMLEPLEIKVNDTRLARKLYPNARLQADGMLLIEVK